MVAEALTKWQVREVWRAPGTTPASPALVDAIARGFERAEAIRQRSEERAARTRIPLAERVHTHLTGCWLATIFVAHPTRWQRCGAKLLRAWQAWTRWTGPQ